jgi:DUF917 family protein
MPFQNKLTKDELEPLVIGGCILGGGGGGSIREGRALARLAFELGSPSFIKIDELKDEDIVFTVSAVGSPAAPEQYINSMDYPKAVQLLEQYLGQKPGAMITNENGGLASVNGLLQSVVLGIPILDVACNGRAHPTGVMGSIQLTELEDYQSVQVAIGGKPNTDTRIELITKGTINAASKMVRQAAVQAGGLVAVARNPVAVSYLKSHGSIGAISHAIEVGTACLKGNTPTDKIENVKKALQGSIVAHGRVNDYKLETINGFDLGGFSVDSGSELIEITFWNEYMTYESNDKRIATFPDLIMTFSAETGLPVTSAELKTNDEIVVLVAPYQSLILGSGMFVEENYKIVEQVLNKKILPYIQPLIVSKDGEQTSAV